MHSAYAVKMTSYCVQGGGEEELKKVPKPLHAYINAVLKHTTYFGFINEAA